MKPVEPIKRSASWPLESSQTKLPKSDDFLVNSSDHFGSQQRSSKENNAPERLPQQSTGDVHDTLPQSEKSTKTRRIRITGIFAPYSSQEEHNSSLNIVPNISATKNDAEPPITRKRGRSPKITRTVGRIVSRKGTKNARTGSPRSARSGQAASGDPPVNLNKNQTGPQDQQGKNISQSANVSNSIAASSPRVRGSAPPIKRGRGRPRKSPVPTIEKRARGRPRKVTIETTRIASRELDSSGEFGQNDPSAPSSSMRTEPEQKRRSRGRPRRNASELDKGLIGAVSDSVQASSMHRKVKRKQGRPRKIVPESVNVVDKQSTRGRPSKLSRSIVDVLPIRKRGWPRKIVPSGIVDNSTSGAGSTRRHIELQSGRCAFQIDDANAKLRSSSVSAATSQNSDQPVRRSARSRTRSYRSVLSSLTDVTSKLLGQNVEAITQYTTENPAKSPLPIAKRLRGRSRKVIDMEALSENTKPTGRVTTLSKFQKEVIGSKVDSAKKPKGPAESKRDRLREVAVAAKKALILARRPGHATDLLAETVGNDTILKPSSSIVEKSQTSPAVKNLIQGLRFKRRAGRLSSKFCFPELPELSARPFTLPFDVFAPTGDFVTWKSLRRNIWCDVSPTNETANDRQGLCLCADKCDDNCLNKILQYECDKDSCPFGEQDCGNRAFQNMQKGISQGRLYYTGYEVVQAGEKGFGLRATRTYSPHALIAEYTGEVVSNDEMQRRLTTVYKGRKHFYGLSLGPGTVIDSGTRGSAARFANHSCAPNCEMQKWHVKGQSRIGLFAGSNGIKSGSELTYDYNFKWFDAAKAQVCKCGSTNCRGTIGRKGTPSDDTPRTSSYRSSRASTISPRVRNTVMPSTPSHRVGKGARTVLTARQRVLRSKATEKSRSQNSTVSMRELRYRARRALESGTVFKKTDKVRKSRIRDSGGDKAIEQLPVRRSTRNKANTLSADLGIEASRRPSDDQDNTASSTTVTDNTESPSLSLDHSPIRPLRRSSRTRRLKLPFDDTVSEQSSVIASDSSLRANACAVLESGSDSESLVFTSEEEPSNIENADDTDSMDEDDLYQAVPNGLGTMGVRSTPVYASRQVGEANHRLGTPECEGAGALMHFASQVELMRRSNLESRGREPSERHDMAVPVAQRLEHSGELRHSTSGSYSTHPDASPQPYSKANFYVEVGYQSKDQERHVTSGTEPQYFAQTASPRNFAPIPHEHQQYQQPPANYLQPMQTFIPGPEPFLDQHMENHSTYPVRSCEPPVIECSCCLPCKEIRREPGAQWQEASQYWPNVQYKQENLHPCCDYSEDAKRLQLQQVPANSGSMQHEQSLPYHCGPQYAQHPYYQHRVQARMWPTVTSHEDALIGTTASAAHHVQTAPDTLYAGETLHQPAAGTLVSNGQYGASLIPNAQYSAPAGVSPTFQYNRSALTSCSLNEPVYINLSQENYDHRKTDAQLRMSHQPQFVQVYPHYNSVSDHRPWLTNDNPNDCGNDRGVHLGNYQIGPHTSPINYTCHHGQPLQNN